MRRKRAGVVCLGLFLAVSLPAGGARAEDCHDDFSPDRPGATNGHATVGFGCVMIESAVEITRDKGVTDLSFPQLFRIGIASVVEARLGYDVVGITVPDGASASASPSDSVFEAKVMAVKLRDRSPGLGMTAGIVVPGDHPTASTIEPSTTLLFDWSFAERWSLGLNLLFSEPPAEEGQSRAPRLAYASVLAFGPPIQGDWLNFYIDGAGGSLIGRGPFDQTVGAGGAFLVRDNIQLDLSVTITVTGDEHPVTFGPGFAWRL